VSPDTRGSKRTLRPDWSRNRCLIYLPQGFLNFITEGLNYTSVKPGVFLWIVVISVTLTLTACGSAVTTTAAPSGQKGSATAWPFEFSILTLNAFLLPRPWFRTDQMARARWLTGHLSGYDAIVFQELFDDKARKLLLSGIAEEYPYATRVVGRADTLIRQDGGIVIVSRWPIEKERAMTFGRVCKAQDCLADKGVAYARIVKGNRRYHLFGTHAQSDFSGNSAMVREEQFQLFHSFVSSQIISGQDPIIFAGDFNVDCNDFGEVERMLTLLDANIPEPCSSLYTWNPSKNTLADGETSQFLDYVMLSKSYLQPLISRVEVLPLQSEFYDKRDLSDHYAVAGHFVFRSQSRGFDAHLRP
jgi:sphingomyelin phosphodiesterase